MLGHLRTKMEPKWGQDGLDPGPPSAGAARGARDEGPGPNLFIYIYEYNPKIGDDRRRGLITRRASPERGMGNVSSTR
jgi:hypothetical protein